MSEFEVRAVSSPGRHGAYDGEHDQTRVFLVDVSLRSRQPLPNADPNELAAVARTVVAGPSRHLLERVAFDVADAVLARWDQAEAVWVRVTKPDPPGLDAAAEAVAVTLSREQLGAVQRLSARRARKGGRRAPE